MKKNKASVPIFSNHLLHFNAPKVEKQFSKRKKKWNGDESVAWLILPQERGEALDISNTQPTMAPSTLQVFPASTPSFFASQTQESSLPNALGRIKKERISEGK